MLNYWKEPTFYTSYVFSFILSRVKQIFSVNEKLAKKLLLKHDCLTTCDLRNRLFFCKNCHFTLLEDKAERK